LLWGWIWPRCPHRGSICRGQRRSGSSWRVGWPRGGGLWFPFAREKLQSKLRKTMDVVNYLRRTPLPSTRGCGALCGDGRSRRVRDKGRGGGFVYAPGRPGHSEKQTSPASVRLFRRTLPREDRRGPAGRDSRAGPDGKRCTVPCYGLPARSAEKLTRRWSTARAGPKARRTGDHQEWASPGRRCSFAFQALRAPRKHRRQKAAEGLPVPALTVCSAKSIRSPLPGVLPVGGPRSWP